MKRHVYFLSGFDPKGAAYYHALYEVQAREQASVNEMRIEVGARQRNANGNSFWKINAVAPNGNPCETTYEFSRWDDLVRQNWTRSTWQLLIDMFFAYRLIGASGEIATVWRLSRKTLIGLAYPLVVLGGGLVLGLLAAAGAATGLGKWGASTGFTGSACFALLALVLWGTLKLEDRLNTTWLIRIFSFTGKQSYGQLPMLEKRIDKFVAEIVQKIRANDVDEILVVGFSVGSILSVSVMARALANSDEASTQAEQCGRPALSLLTLGHCVPMLGLLPQAAAFRQELGTLAQSKPLNWIDFSSPTDWGSFALIDPVTACSVKVPSGKKVNPTMLSPRFHTFFTPATYHHIKRNKRRMHMQYLMAGELPSKYDYFAITSGALTMAQRYPLTTAKSPIIVYS